MSVVRDSRKFSGHPYIGRIARSSLRQLSFRVLIAIECVCCLIGWYSFIVNIISSNIVNDIINVNIINITITL